MRHKWMVMLVVIVTTMTTAQEALKQYDSLKAQAEEWATLRLWASLLNTYAPQDEPLEAPPVTCSASEVMGEQSQPSSALTPDQAIKIESARGQKRDAAGPLALMEVSVPAGEHHNDSDEAGEGASEPIREVALLTETNVREPEALGERADETSAPVSPSDDVDIDSTVHALREVRLVSRALNLPVAEAAPLSGNEDSDAAVRERIAFRARAQKAKAMRRALKALQVHLDRAAKLELGTAQRDVRIELPNGISTALRAADSKGSSATDDFPTAPPAQITRQDLASIDSSGGCASE